MHVVTLLWQIKGGIGLKTRKVPQVVSRETIYFEVEGLDNGNLNVYSSSTMLAWVNVSRRGFKELLAHRVDSIDGGGKENG